MNVILSKLQEIENKPVSVTYCVVQELGNTLLDYSLLLATLHTVDSGSVARSRPRKALQSICRACTSCIW